MKRKPLSKQAHHSRPDWLILILVLMLLAIGLVMVLDASIIEAYYMFADKYHFLRRQLLWVGIGIAVMITAMIIPLNVIKKAGLPVMGLSLLLLIIVLFPQIGSNVQGARRWIVLGNFVIQPSELTKLASVIYFPTWLIKHQRFGPFAFLVGLIALLLLLEPDLGTTIIIFIIAFSMYLISGADKKYIIWTLTAGLIFGSLMIVTSPYRLERLKTFIDPASDPLGASYHIRQVLISLGSGGILGTGFGRSRQKFQFLPEATTDSIFAVIGEETGFIGASLVIIIFMALIFRYFKIIAQIEDPYAKLLIAGVVSWIGSQTILNLSAMVALVPLTGVPLPFISYGGSSLVNMLAAVGLSLNASRLRKV